MKTKGRIRIVIGWILIALQVISLIGNGFHFPAISFATAATMVYSIMVLVGYLLPGIVGVCLLLSGISAKNKSEWYGDDEEE